MAVSKHPSVKPSNPRKPPSDRMGQGSRMSGQAGVGYGAKHEFGGYDHSSEHSSQEYGHDMKAKGHNGGSQFPGVSGGFPKAGDKSD